MPTYEYSCSFCNYTTEEFQKITDAPLTQCPACHQAGLQRGIGGGLSAFHFKGDGFYITDYCKKGNCGCSKKSEDKAGSS